MQGRTHKDSVSTDLGLMELDTGKQSSARISDRFVKTECTLGGKKRGSPHLFTGSYSIKGIKCSQKRLETDPRS